MAKKLIQRCVQLTPEENEKLNRLMEWYDMPMTECFRTMINAEYDNIIGNPEKKQMLEQMLEMGRVIKQWNAQLKKMGERT